MLPVRIQHLINQKSFDRSLKACINEWSKSSNFVEFVKENENKIYKRLSSQVPVEDKRDIGIELYIAFLFSQANCNLIYEPNISSISRGPDFKISFGDYSFYLEVKRLREYIPKSKDNEKTRYKTFLIDNEKVLRKCGDVIIEKIGQTVPNAINLIYIRHYLPDAPNIWDVEAAIKSIKEWIKEEPKAFRRKIRQNKIRSIKELKGYWRQLSGIVISRPRGLITQIWENPEALQPLPLAIRAKVKEATRLSFRGDAL